MPHCHHSPFAVPLLAAAVAMSAVTLRCQDPVPAPAGAGDVAPQPPTTISPPFGQTVLMPEIRQVTRLHNSMPHQLIGIGLVTGLAGTGASDRGTRQGILNVVRQLGLNLNLADVVAGSTSLVTLTCSLPPFAKEGTPIDVKVETLGDAVSLRGGELLRAELRGVDGKVYVVAQGPVTVSGFTAQGQNANVQKNLNTTGRVPGGGLVVLEENSSMFSESGHLELRLTNPTPFNAESVAAGVRLALAGSNLRVFVVDATLVRIELPSELRTHEYATELLARIGRVRVAVENPVKVIIDQASGTILAGEGVLISPCAVVLSDITISVVEENDVVQPNPWAMGQTAENRRTRIEVQTNNTDPKPVAGGTTVAELLTNIKALGLTPQQLVMVFQSLAGHGFLHAELEVR